MDDVKITSVAWEIPEGQWASYGDVAERIGHPGAARAVARRMLVINGVRSDPADCPTGPSWRGGHHRG